MQDLDEIPRPTLVFLYRPYTVAKSKLSKVYAILYLCLKVITNNPFLLSNVIVLIIIHSSIIWFKSKYKNMTYVLNFHDIIGVKFDANGTDTKLKALRYKNYRCTQFITIDLAIDPQ